MLCRKIAVIAEKEKMMMEKQYRPSYSWWVRMEVWNFTQATLLLHGLDPNRHPSLQPCAIDFAPQYANLKKTYLMISQFPWKQFYPSYYIRDKGVHPVAIITLAVQKKLPIPKRLKKLVIERFHQEKLLKSKAKDIQDVLAPYSSNIRPPTPRKIIRRSFGFTQRERKNLLRSLGIVVSILAGDQNSSPRHWHAKQLNASQLAKTIIDTAQKMGLPTKGLKNLNRKITEALMLLKIQEEDDLP